MGDPAMEPGTTVVLGSNSFSGAWYVEHLLRAEPGERVVGVSRSPEVAPPFRPYPREPGGRFEFHQLDLARETARVAELIGDLRPERVVNFAAQSMVAESWLTPLDWFRTNALALAELVHRIHRVPGLRRFVQISTPEVYGSRTELTAESRELAPSTPYAASKAAGDLALHAYARTHGFPVVTTRAANVYGPCQQPYRILPRAAIAALGGAPLELQGGGRARRWFIHIRDVARATALLARRGRPGEVYHLSTPGDGITIRELVEKVCARVGRAFEDCVRVVDERVGQDAAYALCAERIRRELGFEPRIPLDEGIAEVVAWVEKERDEILRQPLRYEHRA